MGADGFELFYGVRYLVSDENEIEQLEERTHPKVLAARKAKLQYAWGRTVDDAPLMRNSTTC
jgi:hypothetical protein